VVVAGRGGVRQVLSAGPGRQAAAAVRGLAAGGAQGNLRAKHAAPTREVLLLGAEAQEGVGVLALGDVPAQGVVCSDERR
jgi:hypothetical protein